MIEFAYNFIKLLIIKKLLFYANYGYEPTVYQELKKVNNKLVKVIIRVEELQTLYNKIAQEIILKRFKSKGNIDKSKIKGLIFKEGDKVFLLRKNWKTKQLLQKLDYIRIRPFQVKK